MTSTTTAMTSTTTVSSKGQITLPAAFIRRLGIKPGQKLVVIPVRNGIFLTSAEGSAIDELAGSIPDAYGDAMEYIEGERGDWT